jgi:hypothetical protein
MYILVVPTESIRARGKGNKSSVQKSAKLVPTTVACLGTKLGSTWAEYECKGFAVRWAGDVREAAAVVVGGKGMLARSAVI